MNEHLPLDDRADCLAARRALELARPGEIEALAPAAANRHVECCPDCQAVFERNRKLDATIGQVCRDVPVPADLQSRLLAALLVSAETAALDQSGRVNPLPGHAVTAPGAANAMQRGQQSRLWRRRSVVAAAFGLALLGAWFVLRPPRPALNLDELTAQAIEFVEPQALPEFGEGIVPPLPRTMDTRFLRTPPRKLPSDSAAVYCFRFKTPRGRIIEGRLLAVPVALLQNPPASTSFLGRPAIYRALGFCSSQWIEGGYAYVCLVKGGEGESDLNRLLPASSVAM